LPEAALFLQGRNYHWIHTSPYYSCPPWPQLLVAAMERWSSADPHRYPQRRLPCPELDQLNPDTGQYWLEEAGGRELCLRYGRARRALNHGTPPAIGRA
jgi:hypothetical protein